jgi:hypothetical protein
VRVWHLSLEPRERIGFHTHVLDYFWTAMTSGKARSRYGDGEIREVSYAAGDTKHHVYAPGEFMTHDLENIGDTPLIFATVEFCTPQTHLWRRRNPRLWHSVSGPKSAADHRKLTTPIMRT